MDHDEIKNLLPLKALDRLEPDEARAVDAHLADGCAECERELGSFSDALAAMAVVETGAGGADVASSDRIWSQLQNRLGSSAGDKDSIRSVDRPPQRLQDRSMRQFDERPPREPARRGLALLTSAAVAALVAFAVSWSLFSSPPAHETSSSASDVAALTARVVAIQRDLDTTGDKLAALQNRITQSTDLTLASLGPDARVAHLAAMPSAPGADGTVAINGASGTAILHTTGLPPTPDDKTYEVWWIGQKQGPLRAGTFDPVSNAPTIVSLNLPPPGEIVLTSAITLEPRGGVDKPTGAMYLKGDFPRH